MKKLFVFLFLFVSALSAMSHETNLLPMPDKVAWGNGVFTVNNNITIGYSADSMKAVAGYLRSSLKHATGYKINIKRGNGKISIKTSRALAVNAYTLNVSKNNITIVGGGIKGVAAAISTLRQLLPDEIESKTVVKGVAWTVPAVKVSDAPRLGWRGILLDVSRHFFSKQEVEQLLDVMALYKMDKFHWHLIDDNGWRIEIKKYPLLTSKSAWRPFDGNDRWCMEMDRKGEMPHMAIPSDKLKISANDTLYGGYYTQDDIREVVAFAAARGIDVVPEIDMPGHSWSEVGAYPWLSCTGGGGPLCIGKPTTLQFCQDVCKEVFALFPYKYFHIGGDEVDFKPWTTCPQCQKFMTDHNIKDVKELQAWFTKEMEKYFNANGRDMIGWDEILEGGVSPSATVMWWRGDHPEALKASTDKGNQVICTPTTHFYLDYFQQPGDMQKIYDFRQFLTDMTPSEKQLVLGIQGNIWGERIPSQQRMWYQAFPRTLAIAEVAWSKPDKMNWDDFNSRLKQQLKRLKIMGVTYKDD